MTESVQNLSGIVAEQTPAGTVCEGTVILIEKGIASDFMTEDQYIARKTAGDLPFILVQVGIPDKGIITDITFRDYSGEDGKGVISPNTMHGGILNTYPNLCVDGTVNMIAKKRDVNGQSIITWKLVLA